ncbi:MAG: CDP-diacylglycerol--glycerol-3-phosphate 3-phosphatidyltransferase [Pseudomonadota bacterium]
MTLTLPNIFTIFRLVAAPGVALVFAVLPRPDADLAALVLFTAASVTDWLDGWLARRWDQITPFGRMLDPIADKAMVMTALAVLLMLSGPDPWVILPAAAILLREVAVSGLREFLAGRVSVPVTVMAKWKTAAQMTAIALLLLAGLNPGALPPPAPAPYIPDGAAEAARLAGLILLWLAGAMTLITGWDYFRRGLASPAMKE